MWKTLLCANVGNCLYPFIIKGSARFFDLWKTADFVPVKILNIEIFGELCVFLDEFAAGFNLIAHADREDLIAGDRILDGDEL